jgi:hypothetical protein
MNACLFQKRFRLISQIQAENLWESQCNIVNLKCQMITEQILKKTRITD